MTDVKELCKKAKRAKYSINSLTTEEKNRALEKIAADILEKKAYILCANENDIQKARENGMHQGMLDRLLLTEERLSAISEGLRQIVALEEPVGRELEHRTLYNDLKLTKVSVPLGVIGIIYESRPNVTADAFGLCFKSGNVVILKGGSDALLSNIAITDCIRASLKSCGITEDAIQIIASTDRTVTQEFMRCKEYVDVLIPRGGAGLIKNVVENSLIPVIETGTGNCHIYIDEFASLEKALPIIINAKTQRIGVCNACESLVIHEKHVADFLPVIAQELHKKNVEIRGDKAVCAEIEDCIPATEEDFAKEYLDLIISVKTVASLSEAIEHINANSTGHSEAIMTENEENAKRFLKEIDSACVYVNASTRFTDGFEFGLGAEIGISTQKLHARGPMGLKELTTYKYTIVGNGQIRK